MASGGIDDNVELSPDMFDDEPASDTDEARFMASGGFGSSVEFSGDFDDSYSDTDEAGLVGAAELFDSTPVTLNLGNPEYLEEAYIRFYYDKIFDFSQNVGYGLNNVNWMRKFVKETSTYPTMSEFCIGALEHLCSNYATKEQKATLKNSEYKVGFMFAIVETLLKECQIDLSEQCDDCKKSKLVKSSSHELPRPKEGDLLPLFAKKRLPHQVPQERSTTKPKRTVTSTPKNIFGKLRAKMKGAFSKDRETMRISPFQEDYLEQLLDDSLLIDETPPRQNSRSFSLPRIEITPPSPTDPRTRIRNSSSPTVITSPPRTPFISKSRFGFTDSTVPPGELNIPPGPFELPTPYRRTIALSSPKREEPVLVNIAVDPKPLIDTERGERFVCDISIDVQPGQSDLRKQLPYASGLSSPHLHDTSAETSRGRTSEMSVSPVIKRGRMGQYHATPVSSGLFTPRLYKRPRRRRIPGSHPISELPWSPTYLPEDARSPVSGVTSPPYLSDESISWERSADSYYGSSPDISPVTEGPTYDHRSPDFWNRSASPVIKRPTHGYPSTSPSPSPVIKRPPYGYRSPDFWSRPIYGYQSPYSDRSSQSRDRSLSPDRSKTSDSRYSPERTNTESERYFQKGPPYDPSIVNEARILDENYFSPGRRTPRTNMESERHVLEGSIYDPSVVNEACFLDDRCSSRKRTDKETERHFQRRSPYDPSIVNEANFLDDRYFSPGRRNTRSPYDPSIVNEANILDDRHSSSGGRTPRSPYDPSIVNEANFLDDRHSSSGRRTPRSPYDSSIINEANCLDDRYSSPDRRTPRSRYDPSIVNEANILDDNYSSADRTNLELERDFLEGSLYDSSIVNEGRFLD